jgi:hypothetical protein
MRSKFGKSEHYFNLVIENNVNSIAAYKKKIKDKTLSLEQILGFSRLIYKHEYEIFCAMYSRGDSFDALMNQYQVVIQYFLSYAEKANGIDSLIEYADDYERLANIVAIGLLLHVDSGLISLIRSVLKVNQVNDFLLEYLFSFILPKENIPDKKNHLHWFGDIIRISNLNDPSAASTELANFMNKKYYQNRKEAYWYGYHLSKFDIFFGYWCWVAAAIAEINGIDDRILENNYYYPYDIKRGFI